MISRIKVGAITGLVAFPVSLLVSFALGACGPIVATVAGMAAGFISAQRERSWPRSAGAQAGAVAGGIVGLILLLAQMVAAVSVVLFSQAAGIKPPLGSLPSGSNAGEQILFVASGLAVGTCFGVFGIAAAAAAGALGGWLGSKSPQEAPGPTVGA